MEGLDGDRVVIARMGEDIAADFLSRRGVRIIGRNLRLGHGEIDIHGLVAGTSVAFEVKTRRGAADLSAAIFQFSPRKAETVCRYARSLSPPAYRVDLVALHLGPDGADVHWIPFAA